MGILDYIIYSINNFYNRRGGSDKSWNKERTINNSALILMLVLILVISIFLKAYSFITIIREFHRYNSKMDFFLRIIFLVVIFIISRRIIINRLNKINTVSEKFLSLPKYKKIFYDILVVLTIPILSLLIIKVWWSV